VRAESIVDVVKQRIKQKPYEEAVKQLRQIQNVQSPSQKLECIFETQNLISKSIEQFWEGV
jgi:NifU-like protein involved in Fe-S cluster formation